MNENICKECGAPISADLKECPTCGYQIEDLAETEIAVDNGSRMKIGLLMKKINYFSAISFLLGIIVVFVGFSVRNKQIDIKSYSAKHYSVEYASFGADFYTYIYGASDTIVDELDSINSGVAQIADIMAISANAIFYPIGMVIIAIGIGIISYSLIHIKKDE